MKPVMAVLRQFIRIELRDKYSLFWNFAFPLILMSILMAVFGNTSDAGGTIVFQVGVVNQADGQVISTDGLLVSEIIEDLLDDISREDGSWLNLYQVDEGQTPEEFLDTELNALRTGDRHVVLVIPATIDQAVSDIVSSVYSPEIEPSASGIIQIYKRSDSEASTLAAGILSQMISNVNTEINVAAGLADMDRMIDLELHQTASAANGEQPFDYPRYLLPGIILMVIMSSGLELLTERLTLNREKGILKRYFATPLSTLQYSGGLVLHIVLLSILQITLIYGFGRLVFNVNIPLFYPLPLLYLLFSLITLLSLGLTIGAICKTANAASTLSNALLYPMMFLGGLFFPVMNMPLLIRWFTLVNPITYLSNGLRDSLGVFPSPTATWLNILVPAIWLAASTIYGIRFFSWDPKGGRS